MKMAVFNVSMISVTGRSNPRNHIRACIHNARPSRTAYGREGGGIQQRFCVNTLRTGFLVLLTSRLPRVLCHEIKT